MTKKRMFIMLLACTVVFGGVFFMKYMGKKGMEAYFNNMPTPPVTILGAVARQMQWSQDLPSVGSLVPVQGTNITTQADGIVEAIHFTGGSTVEAGTLLLTLEADTEKAELKRLQAQAEIATINQRRAEDLYGRKVLSKAEYDQTRAEAAVARAAADAQAARLAQKEIRAPFSGRLGIRQINVGQFISKGTPIVGLQALDPMEIEFALPEAQLSLVETGMPIEVTVDAWPGQRFAGEITVIEPRIEAATRNFRLRGRVANPQGKLRAGMFGRVSIQRPGTLDVVAIPRTAISYDSYGRSVYLIQPAEDAPDKLIARQRFIRIGQARGDFVQVLEGLEAGDQVAAGGLLKLRNGAPVIIDDSKPVDPQLDPAVADS